jgi:hypothetical protein
MNQNQPLSNTTTVVIPPSHPLYTAIMESGKKRPRPFIDLASPPPQQKKSRQN